MARACCSKGLNVQCHEGGGEPNTYCHSDNISSPPVGSKLVGIKINYESNRDQKRDC